MKPLGNLDQMTTGDLVSTHAIAIFIIMANSMNDQKPC